MNEERPKFFTRKTLYEAVEVEVDGEVYHSKKLTRSLLAEVDRLDIEVDKKNREALLEEVVLLLGIETKILEKLDFREVEDILLYVKGKFRLTEKKRLEKEVKQIEKQLVGTPSRKKPIGRIPSRKNVKRPGKKE